MSISVQKMLERSPDALKLLLGLWLIGSPWALGHADFREALFNAYAVGAVIAVAAFAALIAFHNWEEWVSVVLGAWLIAAPWALGYQAEAMAFWNHVVVGAVVIVLAVGAVGAAWYVHWRAGKPTPQAPQST